MDRRSFLSSYKEPLTSEKVFLTPEPAARTNTGLNMYTGSWSENEVIHLLKRTMFGSKKADVDYFRNLSVSQAVDELINNVAVLPAPPVKEYNTTGATSQPDDHITSGTTWVNDPNNDGTIQSRRRSSFKKWWMVNMFNQDRSIREKMTLFWHNHFSTETTEVGNAQYVYKHHAMLRASALGNFRTLVKAITLDPAMLVYLNGQLNTANAPDENYSRELLELFCCGKGPGSQFTETDVKEAAKILTGWRNNAANIASYFDPNRHHTGNKQFSPFFNNTTIAGRTGATAGNLELDEMLTMIFNAQEVSKYVCRRIYKWFIYYRIDSTIEKNVIEPLAAIFRASNYEIKPVLAALLKSEHFFDPLNQGCQIKSPVDVVVGMCRELDVKFQPATDYSTNYGFSNYLVNALANMQQNIGDPPDVSGWKAYYQEPQFYEIWINSDTLPKRNQFTDQMVTNGYTFNNKKIVVDGAEFIKQLPNPADPNILIDDLIKILFRFSLSTASKNQMKTDILLSGQASDHYWTDAWNAYVHTPSNTSNATTVRNRVRDLLKYLMNLSEFQLA